LFAVFGDDEQRVMSCGVLHGLCVAIKAHGLNFKLSVEVQSVK